ncbi:MAG: exosortase E/protease, VPEID-CTERM system, partial [Gammaproteobacteria bacterium]
LRDLREQSSGYRPPVWLVCHLLALAAFVFLTSLVFERPTDPARLSAAWFAAWIALASATLLPWLLALAPGRFWLRLVRQEHTALLMGALLGIFMWMLIEMLVRQEAPLAQKELWSFLSNLTLRLVYLLLGWVYSDLVYQPEALLVGTASFPVEITYACSGIEGISLITVFLAAYLWLFRKELRFPQVFWLFPLGILAIWLANAVRIAMLIAIGTSFSPEIAGRGFHVQAGWIAFTLIALGAIVLSHRMGFFSATKPGSPVIETGNPLAAGLLVPLMILMATSMITAAFSASFDMLYPLHVVAAAAALWYYRKAYSGLGWLWSWQAAAMGGVVFLLWMLLEPSVDDGQKAELARGLAELSTGLAAVWLAFRVLGSVIIVPLVEELAFRGYLLRKLIAPDFENVRPNQFTWFSFIVSSLLFGLLHERFLAGTMAGMVYALALYRRGQLGDAVLAHMTTNALIAICVLVQERWALWS